MSNLAILWNKVSKILLKIRLNQGYYKDIYVFILFTVSAQSGVRFRFVHLFLMISLSRKKERKESYLKFKYILSDTINSTL